MEYTKDIILNIKYEGDNEKESWTSSIYKSMKKNKFIYSVITITVVFMAFDIVLVNNFVNLLSKI
ncbi:MAG: hypothetical protein J6A29_05725 [Clostridia bacterium]|nr:hypothetical protein [Clostridia bacterium]